MMTELTVAQKVGMLGFTLGVLTVIAVVLIIT
jgi:hypothetical protein